MKEISETIKNEAKALKEIFLPLLLGTLAVSILGNALIEIVVRRADEGTIRAGKTFNAISTFTLF